MFTKGRYLKFYSQFGLSLGTKLNYGIIAFFALFYFFGQTTILANTTSKENRGKQQISILHSDISSTSVLSSSHLPFETAPKDWLNEDKEEDENKLYWTCSYEFRFCTSISSGVFLPVIKSIYNQSKVPLFILYHSWRTFLT